MAEKGMLDLLDRLLSVVNKVEWQYDSSSDGYWVRLDPFWVEIRSVDRDGRHPYALVILSGPDETVEKLLSSDELPVGYVEKLERLYAEAQKAKKNLPGVLEKIFRQLPE